MQALIFDMDGVIVDSEVHWKNVEGFFLKSIAPGWTDEDQARIIGASSYDVYNLLVRDYGLKQTRDEFLALYQEMATEIYGEKVSLIDGFRELITLLRERGVPTALASSSRRSWIDIVLNRFELSPCFDVVVSVEDLEPVRGKPAPDIYLRTAQLLGVPPAGCVVIEDSKNGVLSARSAGMYCIGFRNGFNEEQDLSEANVVANGYAEIDVEAL